MQKKGGIQRKTVTALNVFAQGKFCDYELGSVCPEVIHPGVRDLIRSIERSPIAYNQM